MIERPPPLIVGTLRREKSSANINTNSELSEQTLVRAESNADDGRMWGNPRLRVASYAARGIARYTCEVNGPEPELIPFTATDCDNIKPSRKWAQSVKLL